MLRVVNHDGEALMVTEDFREDRVDVATETWKDHNDKSHQLIAYIPF